MWGRFLNIFNYSSLQGFPYFKRSSVQPGTSRKRSKRLPKKASPATTHPWSPKKTFLLVTPHFRIASPKLRGTAQQRYSLPKCTRNQFNKISQGKYKTSRNASEFQKSVKCISKEKLPWQGARMVLHREVPVSQWLTCHYKLCSRKSETVKIHNCDSVVWHRPTWAQILVWDLEQSSVLQVSISTSKDHENYIQVTYLTESEARDKPVSHLHRMLLADLSHYSLVGFLYLTGMLPHGAVATWEFEEWRCRKDSPLMLQQSYGASEYKGISTVENMQTECSTVSSNPGRVRVRIGRHRLPERSPGDLFSSELHQVKERAAWGHWLSRGERLRRSNLSVSGAHSPILPLTVSLDLLSPEHENRYKMLSSSQAPSSFTCL